jgi:hypothetical protein
VDEIKVTKESLGDRGPFLFMGVLCWLCGAVVVGIATQLVFGWVEALVAVAVVTAFVLAIFWSLSSSVSIKGPTSCRK